jgi:hypothetical protein
MLSVNELSRSALCTIHTTFLSIFFFRLTPHPLVLPQLLPQSCRCALLSRRIRRACRRILPDLVMWALVHQFTSTLDEDASARRRLLPLPASGTLAHALLQLLLLQWRIYTEYNEH